MINLSGLEPKKYHITPEGMQELREQLEVLKRRRQEAAEEIREISSQSTDAGSRIDSVFAANHNDTIELDAEIHLLERILGMAVVIERPQGIDTVRLGSQVNLQLNGKAQTFRIVGPLEADPADGKVSDESPLGRMLIGRRAGEHFEVASPTGHQTAALVIDVA